MSFFAKFVPFAALGLLILVTAGCGSEAKVSAKVLSEHRSRLALAEEPEGIQTVADVRLTLLGETEIEDHDHDGDGIQDHAPEDHVESDDTSHTDEDEAHEHDADEGHDEHNHEGDDNDGHDADGHDDDAHDGHDHGEEDGHAHDADESHAEDSHEHDAHEHAHEHVHASDSQEVTVVGHVGGLANPWGETQPDYPFAKSKAVFFLADPQAVVENEESGHVHAPGEECAFCARQAADRADMIAMVQCVDKSGKVLPMDIRQLFELKEKDTVVVHGQARVTEGGILVVDAEGIYIRN